MARTEQVVNGLVVKQKEQSPDILLPNNSIEPSMLTADVRYGLIPLGAVIPVMTNLAGAFAPGLSGVVKDGLILCDGAPIPSGNNVVGTTPNLSTGVYLRGSSTAGAAGGANSKTLSTPQLPSHNHPLTIANDAAPHNHTGSSGVVSVPHSHPGSSSGTVDAPHAHTASSGAVNAPHAHTASSGIDNAPHAHPASTGIDNAPHAHPASSSTGTANAPHGHPLTSPVRGNLFEGGWVESVPNSTPQQFAVHISQPGTNQLIAGGVNIPHSHPASTTVNANNAPHNHPVTVNTNNAPHNHPVTVDAANAPHNHPVTVDLANAPHNHPITVASDSAPHNHPVTVDLANAPHSHPGSSIGTTGVGDSINFEPSYVQCVYVMRVR